MLHQASRPIRLHRAGRHRQQSLRGPRWLATPPANYDARSLEQTRLNVIKGGARLAQLLETIWPDKK